MPAKKGALLQAVWVGRANEGFDERLVRFTPLVTNTMLINQTAAPVMITYFRRKLIEASCKLNPAR